MIASRRFRWGILGNAATDASLIPGAQAAQSADLVGIASRRRSICSLVGDHHAALAGALVCAALLTLTPPPAPLALAAVHGLPRSLFPPHTELHFRSAVSNATIDCTWSFAGCDQLTGRPELTMPVTHLHTMHSLHRLHGWEEDGAVPFTLSFIVWDSRYSSAAFASRSCRDMADAEQGTGFPQRVKKISGGARGWIVYQFGDTTMSLICAWKGSTEIESASSWETGEAGEESTALHYQWAEISAALMSS